MDDLTKCLYDLVCKKRMGSVHQDPEYAEMSTSVDLQTEKIEKDMSKEQLRQLRLLMDDMIALSSIENEHLFQATLRLARELNGVAGIS